MVFSGAVEVLVFRRAEGSEMAAKKPATQKKAKDLGISKARGGEEVKGGAAADNLKWRGDSAASRKTPFKE
jgi:hypothetical protein